MRDTGRIKERYDFSLDSRQLGLVLFAGLVAAALLFVLGMSVGRQWERKTASGGDNSLSSVGAPEQPAAPEEEVPAAPPVEPQSGNISEEPDNDKYAASDEGSDADDAGGSAAIQAMKPEDLTFPKVLTGAAKSPTPKPPPKPPANANSGGAYTVQVGAFKDGKAADGLAASLKKKGYPSVVHVVKGASGTIYKVHVGSFGTRGDAQKTSDRINSSEKIKSYVTSYR